MFLVGIRLHHEGVFPHIQTQYDVTAPSMVGNGFDLASAAPVNPTRALDAHSRSYEFILKVFPVLEMAFHHAQADGRGAVSRTWSA